MVDVDLLLEMNQAVPRYTSYPTAPCWGVVDADLYGKKLKKIGKDEDLLSLYIHIPFCRSMCLYCGCSVVLNRKKENEDQYVLYLLQEIDLVAKMLENKKRVIQIHFGGGTPTQLASEDLERIMQKLKSSFSFEDDAEIAIEVDPRTVAQDNAKKLTELKKIGFNRISFGVQDVNDKVQEAVKRRQSYEVTLFTYEKARELHFSSINIDLIYGLPYQTVETFHETVDRIIELSPDRIALFLMLKFHI